ncbi:hypothetical protein ACFVWN_20420 [Nocardiopsis flavescens]|uniref:hypothetical protein n=1 Tax=Nocardiopsis flavescens TaxID=758803 RepID=UPI00365AA058
MGPHICDNCGTHSEWRPGWSWYGSHIDSEDNTVARTCSPACRDETTDAELDAVVRRRRAARDTTDLTPLRAHRTTTQEMTTDG